jgi:WG containing repeat
MKRINLILIFLISSAISVFAQDADSSLIPYRQGDLWGYSGPYKNIVIKPEYEETDFFYEGFAIVKKGNKYGYINKEGKVVIPIKFFVAKPFRFGYTEKPGNVKPASGNLNAQKEVLFAGASLQANGYEICIDTKGITMPKCPAISDKTESGENKLITTTAVSNYSTIQKSELYDKITGDYKIIAGADETYYIATRNNNYGVFNNKFEVIVPFEYTMIEKVNIGAMVYLKAEKAGLKGILFGTGSPYLAVENSRLQHIQTKDGNNYFIFTRDGKTGLKNTRYQNIAEPVYYDIVYNENGVFIITADDSLKGFCFQNGKIMLPQYSDIIVTKGGAFVKVKSQTGKWGYINNNLIEFFED